MFNFGDARIPGLPATASSSDVPALQRPRGPIAIRVAGRALLRTALEAMLCSRLPEQFQLLRAGEPVPPCAAGVVTLLLESHGCALHAQEQTESREAVTTMRLRRSHPEYPEAVKETATGLVLISGTRHSPGEMEIQFREARRLGASIFVSDEDNLDTLLQAIQRAVQGEWYCSPLLFPCIMRCLCEGEGASNAVAGDAVTPTTADSVARQSLPASRTSSPQRPRPMAVPEFPLLRSECLSTREDQVAQQAVAGRSNTEIARDLQLSVATVKYHLFNAYRKLGITRRSQLGPALQQSGGPVAPAAGVGRVSGITPDAPTLYLKRAA